MVTATFSPKLEVVQMRHLDPSAWQDFRTLRLTALRTDPQAFEASFDAQRVLPDTWWRDRLRETVHGGREWLLFAEQGRRLVGTIGACVSDELVVAEITGVFVMPEARGRGIGGALMRAMLAELDQQHSIQRARLHVNASQTAAVRLYERSGFHLVDTERLRCGDGVVHDVHLMEKLLA